MYRRKGSNHQSKLKGHPQINTRITKLYKLIQLVHTVCFESNTIENHMKQRSKKFKNNIL